MPFKPKPGRNRCWPLSVSENQMPWQIVLGWDGHSNYGWSLNTGRVPWSQVYESEEAALQAVKKLTIAKTRLLTKFVSQIDIRLVRIEGENKDAIK